MDDEYTGQAGTFFTDPNSGKRYRAEDAPLAEQEKGDLEPTILPQVVAKKHRKGDDDESV